MCEKLQNLNAIVSVLNQYESPEREEMFLILAGIFVAEQKENGHDLAEIFHSVMDKALEVTNMIESGYVKFRERQVPEVNSQREMGAY